MNFHLIEYDPYSQLEEFAKDYNSKEYYIYELREKYDWSAKKFQKMREEAINRGLISSGRYKSKKDKPKYYYYHNDNDLFCVVKSVNHERTYFGGYHTEEEALMIIDELEKVGWDKSKLRSIQFKVKLQCIK